MVPAISVPTTTWAPGSASSRPSARIVAGARTVMIRDFIATFSLQKSSSGDARFGEQLSVGDVQHPVTDGAHARVMGDDEQGAVLPARQPPEQLQHLAPDL